MSRYLRSSVAIYRVMVTLTYPSDHWSLDRPKAHLARFLKRIRRLFETGIGKDARFPDQAWSIFWIIEFTKAGTPHFHIFTNRWVSKYWLSETWADIVGSGDPSHREAGTRVETLRLDRYGVCAYAMKYAAKNNQKELPAGIDGIGRWWGVSGLSSVRTALATLSEAQCAIPIVRAKLVRLRSRLAELEFDGQAKMRVGEFCTCWRVHKAAAEELFTRVEELCREETQDVPEPAAVMPASPGQALKLLNALFVDIEEPEDELSPQLSAPESYAPPWRTALLGRK